MVAQRSASSLRLGVCEERCVAQELRMRKYKILKNKPPGRNSEVFTRHEKSG